MVRVRDGRNMTGCTYGDCHHTRVREQVTCQRRLRHERLRDLDQKERLIHEERTRLLLDAERDVDPPMPGWDAGSDDCEACQALRD